MILHLHYSSTLNSTIPPKSTQRQQVGTLQVVSDSKDPQNFKSDSLLNFTSDSLFGFESGSNVRSMDFTSRASLENVKINAVGITTAEVSQVLLVSVHNMIYPITENELHQVFDPYGYIENIIITSTTSYGLQALIHFHSIHCAIQAKNHLYGRNIYNGCCQLDIQYFRSEYNADSTNLGHNDFSNCISGMIVMVEKMLSTVNSVQSRIERIQFLHTQKCELFNNFPTKYRSAKLKPNHSTYDLKSVEQSTTRLFSIETTSAHQTTNLCEKMKESEQKNSFYKEVNMDDVDRNLFEKSLLKWRSRTEVSSLLNLTVPVKLFAPMGGATTFMFSPLRSWFCSFGISQNICFERGNISCADKLYDVMFEEYEYGMFDLMLEPNDMKIFEKIVFIFDPGGGINLASDYYNTFNMIGVEKYMLKDIYAMWSWILIGMQALKFDKCPGSLNSTNHALHLRTIEIHDSLIIVYLSGNDVNEVVMVCLRFLVVHLHDESFRRIGCTNMLNIEFDLILDNLLDIRELLIVIFSSHDLMLLSMEYCF